MNRKILSIITLIATLATTGPAFAGKPLKVFIMAGQSNMQGQAKVRTIERLPLTEDSKQMYADMVVKDGLPSAVKDVYGVYYTGGDKRKGKMRDLREFKGPLKPGFDAEMTAETSFGPEYTFSIYMQKHLNEPFLIIKTAWGGRDLRQQFRPPGAGKYVNEKDRHGNPTGYHYNLMIKKVNEVLANPGKYHPAYKKEDGYEVAGFVWFQGYNDIVGGYPKKGEITDFSEYTRVMAAFIHDVRKDMKTPAMPFVIGAIGIGGVIEDETKDQFQLRKAQMATAAMPEFKGTVVGIRTEQFWDLEYGPIKKKLKDETTKKLLKDAAGEKIKNLNKKVKSLSKTLAPEVLTPRELKIIEVGTSDGSFHYLGSAYIYGKIGKAFADAMAKMVK